MQNDNVEGRKLNLFHFFNKADLCFPFTSLNTGEKGEKRFSALDNSEFVTRFSPNQ